MSKNNKILSLRFYTIFFNHLIAKAVKWLMSSFDYIACRFFAINSCKAQRLVDFVDKKILDI